MGVEFEEGRRPIGTVSATPRKSFSVGRLGMRLGFARDERTGTKVVLLGVILLIVLGVFVHIYMNSASTARPLTEEEIYSVTEGIEVR